MGERDRFLLRGSRRKEGFKVLGFRVEGLLGFGVGMVGVLSVLCLFFVDIFFYCG